MFDVEELLARAGTLATEDRSGWSGSARAARVRDWAALRDVVEAAHLGAVADWDRDRSWADDGAASAPVWLTHHTGSGADDASRTVAAARLSRTHERIGKALAVGELSPGHLHLLTRAARGQEDFLARDVDLLVDVAKDSGVEVFRTVMRRWTAYAQDAHDHLPQRPAKGLHASVSWAGRVRIDGEFEPDDGALLLDAIARHSSAPTPDDTRTPAQRRAAALIDALTAGAPRASIDLIVDLATITGIGAGDLVSSRHDLVRTGPVPRSLIDQYACDATVRRVVFDAAGELLELGRATRVVSPALSRALARRDRHCTWPGCDRPPEWCDAHHVRSWTRDGGATDLSNLTLLCRYHHRLTHRGQEPRQENRGQEPRSRPPPPDEEGDPTPSGISAVDLSWSGAP